MGPKSENHKYFKETLNFLMDEHIHWRRDFHPDDKPVVSLREQREPDFEATLERTTNALLELSSKLKASSMPWFSARYLGHMNSDTLMAANLAYMATILYNPNNCAYEGAPATTALEIEVGKQFATMLGFDPEKAWGHITTDGTIANYEGLWVARNLKSIPPAIKEVKPELVEGMDDWQLLNLPTGKILDLVSKAKEAEVFEAVRERSVRGTGMQSGKLGKLLVPQSKHYSWTKAADVLGIGQANMVYVQVKENYRMDIDVLRATIDKFVSEKTPILGVVTVAGTTEEGAIDEVHEVVKLRDEYEKAGISFYIHVDAAYGGYMRSVFLDENDRFMDFDDLKERLHDGGILHKEIDWPSRDVYDAYKAMAEVDSITLDPHKMGYVPYAAGGVALKDKRAIDLISYFAAYVFEKTEDNPMLLGSYIMEGSKAGASAAAVWAAHRVVPLNIMGYGRIVGRSVEGAARFYNSLLSTSANEIEAAGKKFMAAPLTRPDFNIVDFAFNEVGNTSLEAMDKLNQKIYEQCSYNSGPVFNDDWITSKTDLAYEDYGDAPKPFVARLGIPAEEWDAVRSVYVIRSCVLTPFLTNNTTYAEYWDNFMNTIRDVLAFVVNSGQLRV
ncbi:MAG TPA: tyrosine decarboxylase [Methanosarcinales archaeon]|nr:tyrosine decarboxylase [Methanosarcinales archaeon]